MTLNSERFKLDTVKISLHIVLTVQLILAILMVMLSFS